ncbi:MAG TPA: hypothetical protein VGK19_04895 [Capsulimonadaceae bacterium]|jgi:hypothetical protein
MKPPSRESTTVSCRNADQVLICLFWLALAPIGGVLWFVLALVGLDGLWFGKLIEEIMTGVYGSAKATDASLHLRVPGDTNPFWPQTVKMPWSKLVQGVTSAGALVLIYDARKVDLPTCLEFSRDLQRLVANRCVAIESLREHLPEIMESSLGERGFVEVVDLIFSGREKQAIEILHGHGLASSAIELAEQLKRAVWSRTS